MTKQEEIKNCRHSWMFLRQNKEKNGPFHRWRFFDVFYCAKCLSYKPIEVSNGN